MKRNLTPFTNEPSLEFKYWRVAFSFSPACYWDGLSFLVVSSEPMIQRRRCYGLWADLSLTFMYHQFLRGHGLCY